MAQNLLTNQIPDTMSKRKKEPEPSHPMQPIVMKMGRARFKENTIVSFLLEFSQSKGIGLNQICTMPFAAEDCDAQTKQDAWISKLRSEGVQAAHPDDGWVDREENTITFCYPQFDDRIEIGSKIALGDQDSWRIAEITRHIKGILSERWGFRVIDDTVKRP